MKKSAILKIIMLFNVITFSFFLYGNSTIAEDSLKNEEIRKFTPEGNTLKKIIFIKNKFERNKSYTSIEDEKEFKNILIAVWGALPKGTVEFKNNGKFECKNFIDNMFTTGFWDFQDGTLRISPDKNKKKWKIYRVKNYELSFHDRSSRKKDSVYSFSINFDKMICDMSSVLQISFYTK